MRKREALAHKGFRGIRAICKGRNENSQWQSTTRPSIRCCWLWGEVSVEMQALATLIGRAGELLESLHQPTVADWASNAAIGIVRTMLSIPNTPNATATSPMSRAASQAATVTDVQIYALLAIAEARTSAEGYCDLATGIEDELARNAIGPDEAGEIAWLRREIAQWEREQWRWSEDIARLAGTFAVFDGDAQIGEEHIERAAALMRHYLDEALRLWGAGQVSAELRLAQEVLNWLRERVGPGRIIPMAAIYRLGPSATRSASAARKGLQVLVQHGWVEVAKQPKARSLPTGGRCGKRGGSGRPPPPYPGPELREYWRFGQEQGQPSRVGLECVVERRRIELPTSALRTRRSPS